MKKMENVIVWANLHGAIEAYHCTDPGGVLDNHDEEDVKNNKEGHRDEIEDDKSTTLVFKESILAD